MYFSWNKVNKLFINLVIEVINQNKFNLHKKIMYILISRIKYVI